MEIFIILDDLIEELKGFRDQPSIKIFVINKLYSLRNLYDHEIGFSFNRIIQRLDMGDIEESITMMRELQDEVATPYNKYRRIQGAWHRFADWRLKSLSEWNNKSFLSLDRED